MKRVIAAIIGLFGLHLYVLVTTLQAGFRQETIKVDTTLVTLTATVKDEKGRHVPGLKKEDFSVFEDNVPQELSFFSDERVPMSIGILFDTSGSMADKLDGVEDAVNHFIDIVKPGDEIFLIRFSSHVDLVSDFTDQPRQLQRAVRRFEAVGSTALYDALEEGLQKITEGKNKKKAILLITDGNDTSSRASEREVREMARRSEVLIYCIGIGHGERGSFGHDRDLPGDKVDIRVLRSFSDSSGGRSALIEGAHHSGGIDRIDEAIVGVANELTQQYSLGYYPTNTRLDGAYRRINVKLARRGMTVQTRSGYWAEERNR